MIEGVNWDRLRETLSRDEGCNLNRHEVKGVDHIGYGFNLETPWPDEFLTHLKVDDEDDIQTIHQLEADYLLEQFLQVAVSDCLTVYGEYVWEQLSPLRREVLINLSYNLGLDRFTAFRRMNAAVKNFDFSGAAMEMLDSKAAKQTGDRYKRLATALESNNEAGLGLKTAYDAPVVDASAGVEGKELGVSPAGTAVAGGTGMDVTALSDADLFTLLRQVLSELANRLEK